MAKRMTATPITCIAKSNDRLGEGCLWDATNNCVWWLDIPLPSRIHRLDPATGAHRSWTFTVLLSAITLRYDGKMLVGGEHGLYIFDPATGALKPHSHPDANAIGNRGNDGASDAKGRFWFGTMQQNIAPNGDNLPITRDSGNLYSIEPDGIATLRESDIGVSNGPCWSPDNKIFYFTDSKAQIIWAYDFDLDTGAISNRRVFNDTKDHGYPDGATVDDEGFLWSARWDGACVLRIDPQGRIDRVVEMPAKRPTCVCFGGPNLDTLYVTSSRANLPTDDLARNSLQGGLFCVDPRVTGKAKFRFGDAG
jgi:L-arabinonolactonase